MDSQPDDTISHLKRLLETDDAGFTDDVSRSIQEGVRELLCHAIDATIGNPNGGRERVDYLIEQTKELSDALSVRIEKRRASAVMRKMKDLFASTSRDMTAAKKEYEALVEDNDRIRARMDLIMSNCAEEHARLFEELSRLHAMYDDASVASAAVDDVMACTATRA